MPFRLDPAHDRKLTGIFRRGEEQAYRRGRVIYRRGDGAQRAFVVRTGHVRLTLPEPGQGRERTVGVVGPDEMFGEDAFIAGGRRLYEAWAGEDCSLLAADADRVHTALRSSRSTYAAYLRARESDLLRARLASTELAAAPTRARLADLILDLGDRFGRSTRDRIVLEHWFTHQELADLIGAHRSTVTTVINDWIYEDILEQGDKALTVAKPRELHARGTGLQHLFPPNPR